MTSQIKTLLLLGLLSCTLIITGVVLWGQAGRFSALALVIALSFLACWYSDVIVLRMYKPRELTETEAPMLYATVRTLAETSHIPMPRLYVIPKQAPKAFVAGRSPKHALIVVTEGLVELASPEAMQSTVSPAIVHIAKYTVLTHSLVNVIGSSIAPIASIL